MLKKFLLCLLSGFIFQATSFAAKELDRVYAIVNEDVITKTEYDQEYLNTTLDLKARGQSLPEESVLRRQILDRMISERLQLQVAARAGIQISPAQVDSAIQTIAQRNNLNIDQLKQALDKDGVSFDSFSKRIEDQLIIQQIVERQINSQVDITDEEVDEFLRSESTGTGLNAQFNVSHIVVPISSTEASGYEQARARIDQARQALVDGADFGRVASEYSAYEDAIEGGNLGWRKSGELPGIYYQALRRMSQGEISDVLQSESAFHLIKLNQIRSATPDSEQQITQLRVRQIFLEFDRNTTPEFMRLRMNEIGRRLRNGEDFAALAEFYSEDAASRIKGGDMGWISPGDFGSVVESVLFNLPMGVISEPVQSGNGISLFEVTDKRQKAAGNLFEKNAAREQLHVRKAEKLYQDWLQELRDSAYVQYLADEFN